MKETFKYTLQGDRLLVKNKMLYLYLKFATFICGLLIRKPNLGNNSDNSSILLSNIAHMGDVVLTTCILSRIKQQFPDSKIGFICNSVSKSILNNHPLIDKLYYVDHWKLNRSNISAFLKFKIYIASFFKSLKQIKADKYDVAIDFYYYYPNTIPLLAMSGIPEVVAYTSGGFKNLLSKPIEWVNKNESVMSYHNHLVDNLIGHNTSDIDLRPCLKPISDLSIQKVTRIFEQYDIKKYVIFHCGAGLKSKLWSLEKWRDLADRVTETGLTILFTGSGESDSIQIAKIIENSSYINLCDLLNFDELAYVVKCSSLLVCADTLIVHIASAYNTPCVVVGISKGLSNHFRPTSSKSANFSTFESLMTIGVNDVYKKIFENL